MQNLHFLVQTKNYLWYILKSNFYLYSLSKSKFIIYFTFIFLISTKNAPKLFGQDCEEMFPPSYISVVPINCEGSIEICLNFQLPASFYTILKFKNSDFIFTQSDYFEFLDNSAGITKYSSISNLMGYYDITTTYCLSGVNLLTGSKDITLIFEFYNNINELCYTTEVVLKKQIVLSGDLNLTNLLGSDLLSQVDAPNYSQNIYIDGTLTIDDDYVFGKDANGSPSNILMADNAKIIVANGKELTFNGTVVKDCGVQWDKIELNENSKFNSIGRGTHIEGGKYGLYMHGNSTASINFTDFLSNEWGLYAPSETPYSVSINCFGARFDGGIYESTAIGMELYDLPTTVINNISTFFGPQAGQFKNLKYGIKSFNSALTLLSPTMNDISNTGVLMGANNGISSNSILIIDAHLGFIDNFTDLNTAINVYNTDLFVNAVKTSNIINGIMINSEKGYTTDILNSTINVNSRGISIYGRNGAYGNIVNNDILVYNEHDDFSGFGISGVSPIMVKTNEWNINDNLEIVNAEKGPAIRGIGFSNMTVNKNEEISTFDNSSAIIFQGGESNKISCNSLISADGSEKFGIDLRSSPFAIISSNADVNGDGGILINGTCEQSNIKTNTINSQVYDIQYGINSNSYSLTGVQRCKGNCFNSPNDYQARHYSSDASLVAKSKYYVRNVITCLNPTVSPNNWFDPNCSTDETIPSPCIPGVISPDTSLYSSIKNGSIGSHEYEDNILYTLRSRMYRYFIEEDTIPNGYATFVSGLESGNIGAFHVVRTQLGYGLNFTDEELAGIDTLNTQIRDLVDTLAMVYRLDSHELEFTGPQLELIDSFKNELIVRQRLLDTLRMSRDARLDTILPACLEMLDEITPTNIIEENQKAMFQIVLPYLIDHIDTISSEDLDAIDTIATQCDLSGGEAVFQARAIIFYYRDTIYDDEILCEVAEPLVLGTDQNSNQDMSVIPNPSDNNIKITLNHGKFVKELTVFDVSGKEIDHILTKKESTIEYSTKQLKDGLYLLRIEDETGQRFTKMHLVQH